MSMSAALPDALRPRSPDGWRDRLHGWIARRVADPDFRRWALAFPLTRPIARRRARALFDLCAGFVYSQVLLACVELRLFERLAQGPRTLPDLAADLGLPEPAAARLLAAAVALRLVAHRADRFGLGSAGAALVGNPGLLAMVEHHRLLYGDLRDPVALLRGTADETALSQYWPYAGGSDPASLPPDHVLPYTRLMAASQPMVAAEVLGAYALRRHRCLLDVGGGDGSFLVQAARQAPGLRLILFDLPAVADRARGNFKASGLADQATSVGGDFHVDPLPLGADIVSLVRILHDHDDDAALAILLAARKAMPAGGTLLLAEPMAGTPGAEPVGAAYFGFYLLAMGAGRPRSRAEYSTLMAKAGFGPPRHLATHAPMLASVLVARAS